MSDYKGLFVVVNGDAVNTITNVNVVHTEDGVVANADALGPGQSVMGSNPIMSSGTDNWNVSFRDHNGNVQSRDGKECGLESDDNGQVAVIVLYPSNFTVLTPQSSPCLNNHY